MTQQTQGEAKAFGVRSRKCLRCGHVWLPRKQGSAPVRCARCKRADWNKRDLKAYAREKVAVPFYERAARGTRDGLGEGVGDGGTAVPGHDGGEEPAGA